MFWEWVAIRLRMGVPMGVVVWGYRGGVGALRIPYKLSTFGKFRYMVLLRVALFFNALPVR